MPMMKIKIIAKSYKSGNTNAISCQNCVVVFQYPCLQYFHTKTNNL
jgi:hypothetical protein